MNLCSLGLSGLAAQELGMHRFHEKDCIQGVSVPLSEQSYSAKTWFTQIIAETEQEKGYRANALPVSDDDESSSSDDSSSDSDSDSYWPQSASHGPTPKIPKSKRKMRKGDKTHHNNQTSLHFQDEQLSSE